MPIIVYKNKFKDYELSFAFNLEYIKGYKLKNKDYNELFSENIKNIINESIENFNEDIYQNYLSEYKITFIALTKYFMDKIPDIFSIKYENNNENSIFYADEIQNLTKND